MSPNDAFRTLIGDKPVPKGKRRDKRKLSPAEIRYAAEMIKPGMSKKEAARAVGLSRVPQRIAIEEFQQELVANALTVADITVEKIILELGRIAFFDPGRMFDSNGHMKRIVNMDPDTRAAIQGFDVEQRVEGKGDDAVPILVLKPRMYNKNQALEILSRMEKLPGMKGQKGPMIMPQVIVNFVEPPKELGS